MTSHLPIALKPFEPYIEKSIQQYCKIQFIEDTPTLTASKIGGTAYNAAEMLLPIDSTGQEMLLLAQLNFDEIKLNSPFPTKGLLQIFINQQFGNPHFQEEFSIRFIENYTAETFEFSSDNIHNNNKHFPIKRCYKIAANLKHEPVSSLDYRFNDFFLFDTFTRITDDERTFEEIYFETFLGAEHKIGGYPYFIENDFRLNNKKASKYDTLLFQLVSDDQHLINYGDSGIISFFINSNKLQKKDFSDVYMHVETY